MVSNLRSNRSRFLFIVIGVAVVLLGAGLVFYLLVGNQANLAPARTVDVVVTTSDIPPGTQIRAAQLAVVKFSVDQVPEKTAQTIASVVGQYTAVDIPKNAPVLSGEVVSTIGNVRAPAQPILDIPVGQVAIAIPSGDALSNVRGNIQSGDKIDVMVYGLPGMKAGSVKVAFHNLTIQMASAAPVPQSGAAAAPAAAAAQWVVFVPLDQAQELTYAFTNGQFRFALLSKKDVNAKTEPPVPDQTGTAEFNAKYGIR